MSELSELMIARIEAAKAKVNDHDQRSAIGMARTWVDRREPIKRNSEQIEYPNRDQLAKDLVAEMEAHPAENSEYVEALLEARKHINAPYLLAGRTGGAILKPGERRKLSEKAKAE